MKLQPKFGLSTALALVLTLPACWTYSLHPLYDDEDVVYDPLLEGTWLAKDKSDDCNQSMLAITGDSKSQEYTVVFTDSSNKKSERQPEVRFAARLVQLGTERFLDAVPNEDAAGIGALPTHNIFKVVLGANSLVLLPLSDVWLCGASEAEQSSLGECVDGDFVLMAHTDVLQDFVKDHADDEGVFPDADEDHVWYRDQKPGDSK